jgi:tetratricopeptide (TPR) repeat protein
MKLKTNSVKTLNLIASALLLLSFNVSAAEGGAKDGDAKDGDVSEGTGACNMAMTKGDAVTAVMKADDALKIKPSHHQAWLCKGRALGAMGKYTEALYALEQGEKHARDQFEGIVSFILIGNLHRQNNKNTEAIASYERSIEICKVSKNDKYTRITHNLIGEAQTENKDFASALINYQAGSKLALNDNERADSFERLAATHLAMGQMDAAIEHQLKGVLMQQKAGTPDQYANASIMLASLHTQAKDYLSAENTYNKLIQFAKDNGGAYYEGKGKLLLGDLKLAIKDSSAAKVLMTEAQTIANSIKDAELIAEVNASMKKLPK